MHKLALCVLFTASASIGISATQPNNTVTIQDISAEVRNAVNHPHRIPADVKRDKLRKPDKVIEFSGVKPGMRVFDFFAGGGYYTELLSYVVGSTGEVVSHNNNAYVQFTKKQIDQHLANNRLPNVTQLVSEVDELNLKANSFDSVFMILAYHDLYYQDNSWAKIDSLKLRKNLFRALKPGATVTLVDHHAAPGSPHTTGTSLHRIDPQIVVKEMEEVGFEWVKQANFLHNPSDDLHKPMFDSSIRGKTNRFVYLFRKPK